MKKAPVMGAWVAFCFYGYLGTRKRLKTQPLKLWEMNLHHPYLFFRNLINSSNTPVMRLGHSL